MTVVGAQLAQLEALRKAAASKLDLQFLRGQRLQFYYDGEYDIIALLDTDERQVFRKLLQEAGADWCELIVNAVAERLQVVGFRFAGDGSTAAWDIWQASCMDSDGELVQTDALVTGQSFALVQPDDDNPMGVEIAVESPFEVRSAAGQGNGASASCGYKRFMRRRDGDLPEVAWMGVP